ncbi:MAG: DUF1273 domain-containing protein [Eubacteriales bacterium]|nr:DUF1273 domain-containing protein [Eubacteriales bacterium]
MQNPFDRARGCCFTGHRPNALPDLGAERKPGMRVLTALLDRAVMQAVSDGYTEFYAGGALGFDTLAAEAVLRMQANDPSISLHLALPGHDQTNGWDANQLARYNAILLGAAEVWYAAEHCSPSSMQRRNRYLVDHANRCVAYLRRMKGGTLYTVNYALDSKLEVDNLAERLLDLEPFETD